MLKQGRQAPDAERLNPISQEVQMREVDWAVGLVQLRQLPGHGVLQLVVVVLESSEVVAASK